MILTLELPPGLADKVAAIPETERNQYVFSALAHGLSILSEAATLDKAWWDSLTPKDQEAFRADLAHLLAETDADNLSPIEEVYAQVRAKYALSPLRQGEQGQ